MNRKKDMALPAVRGWQWAMAGVGFGLTFFVIISSAIADPGIYAADQCAAEIRRASRQVVRRIRNDLPFRFWTPRSVRIHAERVAWQRATERRRQMQARVLVELVKLENSIKYSQWDIDLYLTPDEYIYQSLIHLESVLKTKFPDFPSEVLRGFFENDGHGRPVASRSSLQQTIRLLKLHHSLLLHEANVLSALLELENTIPPRNDFAERWAAAQWAGTNLGETEPAGFGPEYYYSAFQTMGTARRLSTNLVGHESDSTGLLRSAREWTNRHAEDYALQGVRATVDYHLRFISQFSVRPSLPFGNYVRALVDAFPGN